jgi:hypothetical protein
MHKKYDQQLIRVGKFSNEGKFKKVKNLKKSTLVLNWCQQN